MKTYKNSKLSNGLTILTIQDKNSPIITVSFCFKSGARYEDSNELGYAHLLEHMLLKGTKKRPSAEAIGIVADRAGSLLSAETNVEYINIYAQFIKDQSEPMLDLLEDLVLNPLFANEILENEKGVIFQEIHRAKDSRASLWYESTSRLFEGHPLGRNVLGDEKIIRSATSENLRKYYNKLFSPDRTTFIVNSDMDHESVLSLLEKYFGGWKTKSELKDASGVIAPKRGEIFIETPGKQTQLFFNFTCPGTGLRDLIGLKLIAHILGYGKAPILKQELRNKGGLIYSIGVNLLEVKEGTLLYVSTASTEPEKVICIVKNTMLHLEDFITEKVFDDFRSQYSRYITRVSANPFVEIDAIKEFWVTHQVLMSVEQISQTISSISYEDFLEIKNKYITENNLFITVFGEKNA
jgi:predicted Zn-dependent peptidase